MSHRYSKPVIDEPVTITAFEVSDYLERSGRPRMALFVRRLGQMAQDAHLQAKECRQAHDALVARLHVYEPPVQEPESYSGGVWTGD